MRTLLFIFLLICKSLSAQELYVNTEPASNMAAHSIGLRLASKSFTYSSPFKSRISPEIMFGISKMLMIHMEGSFSDVYQKGIKPESFNIYGKYRLYNIDGLKTHFRVAGYARVSLSKNSGPFEELNPEGDVTVLNAGIVATQLLHKLAISGVIGYLKPFNNENLSALKGDGYNYSLSLGYLMYPRNYTSYKQVNINVYLELLGKTSSDITSQNNLLLKSGNNIGLAPAIQFIFNSQTRVDFSYKNELSNNSLTGNYIMIRIEHNLFNVWKEKPSKTEG